YSLVDWGPRRLQNDCCPKPRVVTPRPRPRLPDRGRSRSSFNRPTAEVPANRIADSSPSDVYVSDPFVSSTTGGDVIQMQYEMKGESHQRVLRTVNQVESFLKSPN